jgi:hypothetical protein
VLNLFGHTRKTSAFLKALSEAVGANWNLGPLRSLSSIATEWEGGIMVKAGILWLLGVPVVVIILLALFTNVL